jgi:hypothetical protein
MAGLVPAIHLDHRNKPGDDDLSRVNQMTGELPTATIQYADGKVVPGEPVDVDNILAKFEHVDVDARSAFLCIIAHDMTVAIRSIVFDPPVTEAALDRVKWINESLHHLTSCINPSKRWSAHDEAELIRGIIENSFEHGFDGWIGRAVAVAARNMIGTDKPVAAK